MVRPATPTRMVANAMAEMKAKKMLPANAWTRRGALRLVPPCRGDEVATDDGGCSEAEEGGHDVEASDQDHGPHHALACCLGVGHRVEADQDVGQPAVPKIRARPREIRSGAP